MIPTPVDTAEVRLSEGDLARLTAYLYQVTGMSFGESKRYYIERRVADRVKATASGRFASYFAMLTSSTDERQVLINAFTVNETYFYREEHQLRALSADMLPEVVAAKAPGDKVRIWSVPCSTGEEPYSIALWLLENWKMVDAYNVEIVGSDIDSRALEEARYGEFGERALGRLTPDLIAAYFEAPQGGQRRIIGDLRESVTFTPVNLIDAASMAVQGRFDVVFCRNVLIYFDEASRMQAADTLFHQLNPGGFLCLGHTESMSRIDARYALRRFPDAIVYQRPAATP